MKDLIERQAVIDTLNFGAELLKRALDDTDLVGAERARYEWELELTEAYISDMKELPPAQSTEASCWGCNCPKMERLKEQKTFSEMVHLHDAETHDKHTETHGCDLISRQKGGKMLDIKEYLKQTKTVLVTQDAFDELIQRASAQPERKTGQWLPDNRSGGGFWVCSCCKFPSEAFSADKLYNYCPVCGAKMEGNT